MRVISQGLETTCRLFVSSIYQIKPVQILHCTFNNMSKRNLVSTSPSSPGKKSKRLGLVHQSEDQKLGYSASMSVDQNKSDLKETKIVNLDPNLVITNIEDMQKKLHKLVGKKEAPRKPGCLPVPSHKRTVKPAANKIKSAGSKVVGNGLLNATNAEKYSFEYLGTPLKPASDKKEYRVIQLKNGLRAILISDVPNLQAVTQCEDESSDDETDDESGSEEESGSGAGSGSESSSCPEGSESEAESDRGNDDKDSSADTDGKKKPSHEEKMAAVGLTVGVGSFSDPDRIPGLAHFLEHMVFMGSQKYPKENHFDSFIKRQGGSDNAHTDCETTTFYFECQEKYLLKGMDKFVQFFKSPLMKKEAMTRERQAVESEFQESMSSDYDRVVQLMASLAKRNHPATKFTWGNATTLHQGITDAGIHKALHSFRKRHYSGHRMTLAVQARLPMDDLEVLVAKTFSIVPNNGLPADDFTSYKESFATPAFHRLYRVASVKDRLSLDLTWMCPPCLHLYRSKPYEYMESILDHEGSGTLLHHLREKLWALSMSAEHGASGFENNSMYFLFSINVTLTEEGYANVDKVVTAVFGYLKMLQRCGPDERYFNEMKTMSEANFDYCDESQASDYVEELSEGLQYYQPEDCIAAQHLLWDYRPELIKEFQDALTVDSVNVIVSSLDKNVEYDQEEKWFKTKYTVADIPAAWLKAWHKVEPHHSFRLPDPNRFIPTDFDLLPTAGDEFDEEYPIVIDATPLCEVWYKRDTKFKQPIGYYYYYLVSPLLRQSASNAVMLDIYADMLEHQLSTELYAAKAAAISYNILPCNNGISIRVGGFNQELLVVLETIFKHMATFKDRFQQDLFDAIKINRSKAYFNTFLKPGKLNSDLRLKVLVNDHWTTVEKHAAIEAVDGAKLVDFVARYHTQLYAQSLVQGNVTRHDALAANRMVARHLECDAIPEEVYPQYRISQLELGNRVLRAKSYNTSDPNSVITNYYQSGPGSVRSSCLVELAMTVMEEPLFDKLRTKEQLGYDVNCEMRDTHGILGYTISVHYQEDKRSIDNVNERIESFLESFYKSVNKMTEKKLDEARLTLIKLKQCSDVYLKEEAGRNWSEILSNEYMFDRHHKEIKMLTTITFDDIKQWISEHFECGAKSNYRKLSIQVVGLPKVNVEEEKDSCKPAARRKKTKGATKETTSNGDGSHPASPDETAVKYPLQLITNKDDQTFIEDIDNYRRNLFVHPLHRILK